MFLSAGLLMGIIGLPSGPQYAAGAGSAFAAGAAVLFGAWQYGQTDEYTRSKFALDTAMAFVERAHVILDAPPPATRIQWVHAGRVLARAMKMAKALPVATHREAWEQFREEWRIKFYRFLCRSPE